MQLLATAWWVIFNKNDRVFASIREQAAQAQHTPLKALGGNGTTAEALVGSTDPATRC